LARAKDDLDACKQLLRNKQLTHVVCFHAQQAVEKSFKAMIEEYQIAFVKIHNLMRLYEFVKVYGLEISEEEIQDKVMGSSKVFFCPFMCTSVNVGVDARDVGFS